MCFHCASMLFDKKKWIDLFTHQGMNAKLLHMKHLICNALVSVIYSVVSSQYSYTIPVLWLCSEKDNI